ncbi:MAG: recombinase family protein [Oscillospiraceae bacterium]|nr:recombinase family protein [Oscillospiraceae bacterium]
MKVAIYCRLSEEDKDKQTETDDSESIQNQKNMLIEFSIKNGWDIYDIYSDDDYRGSDRNRPEFNRLLADAEERRFDIILCKSQSRFTREMELVEKYIHGKFIEWNIRFIGYADNADTENKGNKKARQINGLVNEWYLEDISNNIKSVFDTKKRAGKHIGSFAVYGYQKDPNKEGHLIIDEEAAKVVREVFEMFVAGYSKTPIARMLNEKGIPNPTEYKRQKGLRYKQGHKNSTLWKYFSVSNILTNEMYIGTMVQNRYKNVSYKSSKKICIPKKEWIKIPNMHEPIIDMGLWNKAQALIKQRFKPCMETKKIGIFAKKVKCIYCGYYMKTSKTREDRYLQCTTKFIHKGACPGSFVSYKTLERAILNELKSMIEDLKIKDEEVNQKVIFENRLQGDVNSINQNIIDYNKKIDDATEAVRNLYLDKVKGTITDDEFIEFSKEFHEDKEKYKILVENAEKEIEQIKLKLQTSLNKEELFEKYKNIDHLERIHMDSLIDYIEVGKRIPKTKNREINIYWNF